MDTRTTTNLMALCAVLAATGCATSGDDGNLGTIASNRLRAHADAVRAIHRADRAALGAMAALFRETFGARGTVVERTEPDRHVAGQRSESESSPPVALVAPYREPAGPPVAAEPSRSIVMTVGPAEMQTAEGTLHPRAARALARMNELAHAHGGEFSVAVPRSHLDRKSVV